MKPYIFAFDPGLTTGWAFCVTKTMEVISGEEDFNAFTARCETWFRHYGDELDVCGERFTINMETAKKTQAPWSLEVIGVTKFLAAKYGCGDVTLQMPADAKRFCTNDRIRTMGWWTPGTKGHDKDALRHLMIRLVKLGWSDERLISAD